MRKIVITLNIFALIVGSCGQSTKNQTETADKKNTVEENIEKIEAVVTIPMENGEENFKAFLEKFGTDSVFQVSRIVFPLKVLEYVWDENGDFINDSITVSTRNLEGYDFMTGFATNSNPIEIYGYEYPTEADIEAFKKENKYFAEVMARSVMRIAEDEYFVHFFAMEACGRIGYHFKKDNKGQWYLVEIDAKST